MTKEDARNDIKALMEFFQDECGAIPMCLEYCLNMLEREPKTGHWIPLGNYDDWGNLSNYKCSECGEPDTYTNNFCSNCGAKMESEVEE